MTEATQADDALVDSWMLALHAKSAGTRRVYDANLRAFRDWLAEKRSALDLLHVTRRDLDAYFAALAQAGLEGNTRRNRWTALRAFYGWCVDEEELDASPMAKVAQPQATTKPVRVLRDDDLERLLKSVSGKDFLDRRDLAILRIMAATGLRVSEVAHLHVADVDLANRMIVVRKGKGDKARVVRIDPGTATAVDRYLRARARHRWARNPGLWLGHQGTLTTQGVQQMVEVRSDRAGVGHVHPHMLRHTWAHRYLANGGSEGDLARLGGWDSMEVLRRYGSSVATERALAAYDTVNVMRDL